MTAWLEFLPIEIEDVEELKEPKQEIQKGETVVGEVPPGDLRKLWSLHKATSRQVELLRVEQKFEPTDERKEQILELHYKSSGMQLIFWIGIHDILKLWASSGQLDLRAGWQVVTVVPRPQLFPFSFLGGGPEE